MVIRFYTPEFYVFNNFSAHSVEFQGNLYPTSEHAYQAAKCIDPVGRVEIQNARSPLQAKELANEKYRDVRDPEWDSKKVSVLEEILRAKLTQHREAREALRESGDEEIIEDSPTDYFWGEGVDGTGQNMLGKLWMKLRDEQQRELMKNPSRNQWRKSTRSGGTNSGQCVELRESYGSFQIRNSKLGDSSPIFNASEVTFLNLITYIKNQAPFQPELPTE
ncbi:NADAR domain-containing protein [Glycomyces sp. NPDC047369]